MKIVDVKKKYKNSWVLAEVLKENELNQPVDVKPILSSDDPDTLYTRLAKLPKNKTYATLYTGKMEGVYIFNAHSYV